MPSCEGESAGPDPPPRGSVTNGSLWPLGLAGSPICTQKQGHKFPCCKCKSCLVFHIQMARNSPREQARLRRIGTTTAYFWRCWHHVDRRLPTASMMPLGSPVPFTSFTTHPSRGCTVATGPCTQPDRIQCLYIDCSHSFQLMDKSRS